MQAHLIRAVLVLVFATLARADWVDAGPKTYTASATVPLANTRTVNVITQGDVSIVAGGNVTYTALSGIRLEPGFSVTGGGQFHAIAANDGMASIVDLPLIVTATVGQYFSYTVTAVNGPITAYDAMALGGLPDGLTYDTATGTLSGTPTTATPPGGYTNILQHAYNAAGQGPAAFYGLKINAANTAPMFTSQPQDQALTVGGTATFSVSANGVPTPTLQWQQKPANGSTWVNLSDDNTYSGTTTTTLTVANVSSAMNGDQFRCVVTNSVGSTTSTVAALTLNSAPIITTQPQSQTAMAGAAVTFTVATSGSPAPTYQWQRKTAGGSFVDLLDDVNYSGTTTNTLTVTGTTSAMSGDQFRCVVTNSLGTVTSANALLTVTPVSVAPTITTQPQSLTVDAGSSATFSVVATGTAPLTYQWSKNGTQISGATGTSYTVNSAQTSDEGGYGVTVTNSAGLMASNTATLTVNSSPTNPPTLNVTPGSATAWSGFSYQIVATGATSYSASGLPAGLSVNDTTGEIYGTPTQSGTYTVTLTAINSAGRQSATTTFTVAAGDATTPGALPGEVYVDNKGAANYNIALPLPPGRAGMQPKLGLNYNSNGGNGPLGIGYSLSTGYPQAITRGRSILARDGVVRGVNFDTTDKFYLDGKRLVCVDGDYGQPGSHYRTEVDSFQNIVAVGTTSIDAFVVTNSAGFKYIFGKLDSTNDGFQKAGDETGDIAYAYALKKVEDTVGNYILFTYTNAGGGEHPLTRIDYTGNGSSTGAYHVDLSYETDRPDQPITYLAGRSFAHSARLAWVYARTLVNGADQDAAAYQLVYEIGGTGRSRLKSIAPNLADPGSHALRQVRAITLNWQDYDDHLSSTPIPVSRMTATVENDLIWGDTDGDGKDNMLADPRRATACDHTLLGDLDGDGKKDRVIVHIDPNSGGTGVQISAVLANGQPISALNASLVSKYFADYGPGAGSNHLLLAAEGASAVSRVTVADLNGDGRDDILIHGFDGRIHVFLSQGSSFADPVDDDAHSPFVGGDGDVTYTTTWSYDFNIWIGSHGFVKPFPCDLNGDGRMDYAFITYSRNFGTDNSGNVTSYSSARFMRGVLSMPDGTFSGWFGINTFLPISSGASPNGPLNINDVNCGAIAGDFNGDGLTDFLVLDNKGILGQRWLLLLNRGGGFDLHPGAIPNTVTLPTGDVVNSYYTPTTSRALPLGSLGSVGLYFGVDPQMTKFYAAFESAAASTNCFVYDVNHDGLDDLVWYVALKSDETAVSSASRGWWAMLSTGNCPSPDSNHPTPAGFTGPMRISYLDVVDGGTIYGTTGGQSAFTSARINHAIDYDGDGHPDFFVENTLDGEPKGSGTIYLTKGVNDSPAPFGDLVSSITDGLGRTTKVAYKAAKDDSVYTTGVTVSYPIRELRAATPVVSDLDRDAGSGSPSDNAHFTYQYSGNRLDLSGRGALGFHSFVTLDQQTQIFKYQFLTQSFPMTGLTAREETYRYLGSGGFRFISAHDNTVVFDEVVKSDTDSTKWGTVYPFISKAVESRWEDAATAHFSVATGGLTSAPEALFPKGRPAGTHIRIAAESSFDGQSQSGPQISIPIVSGVPNFFASDTASDPDAIVSAGLTGQYYKNTDFTEPVLTRIDPTINFTWGNDSPDTSVPADGFSVRWSGQIVPKYSETYTFSTVSDDGVRLWVNGQQIIDNWTVHGDTTDTGTISLTANQKYDIKLEYYDGSGAATAKLAWQSASQPYEIVPQSQLFAAPQNVVTGVSTYSSIQSLGLPGKIYYGNLTKLATTYDTNLTETVDTTYKAASGPLTGLVDTVKTTVTSPGKAPQIAPIKSYTYWGNTTLVATETINAAGDKLDLTTTYNRDTLGRVISTEFSGYNDVNDPQYIGKYTVSSAENFDDRFDLPQTTKTAEPYYYSTTIAYDPFLGLPTSTTDVNNATVKTTYDALGRPLAVVDELKGLAKHTEYRWTSASASDWTKTQSVSPPAGHTGVASGAPITGVTGVTVNSAYVVKVTETPATSYIPNKPTVWTYYDRLGRVIRTIRENFNGKTITDTAYNSLGQMIAVSLPYPENGTVYWTKTVYDALGRVATVTAPNGTVTTTTYQGRATVVSVDAPSIDGGIDPAAQVSATVVDARGRTIKVWNPDPTTGAGPSFTDNFGTGGTPSIVFDLDGFGRMVTTTLKGQSATIKAEYDDLGRQTVLDDPDKGRWTYLNNALGQVVYQKDANGNETTSTFDHLGRPLVRSTQEPSPSTAKEVAKWFYYDTAALSSADTSLQLVVKGGQGWTGSLERTEASTDFAPGYAAAHSGTATAHYYNSKGLPSIDLTTMDDKWFYTYSTYDAFSRLKEQRYYWRPAGAEDVSQSPSAWQEFGTVMNYDAKGYVLSVTDNTARTWWRVDPANGYDYLDRPVVVKKGSVYWTKREYRPEDGVLKSIKTGLSAGDTAIQGLSYTYDALGNLRSRSGSGGTESLDYDALNRLTSDKQGAVSYSENGNIKQKIGVAGQTTAEYGYNPTHPHAVQTAFGYTMGYDLNGNLNSRTGNSESWSFKYPGFDKPRWMTKTVGSNSVGSEFLYDANRSRTVHLEYNQADGTGAPTHYVRKRVYGLGPTLEVNYNNDASSGTPTWTMKKVRIYVPGPEGVIGAREYDNPTTSGGTETALVYHYDHLGSIDSITPFASTSGTYANDGAGKPARFSEDAWGQRRNPLTWSGAPTTTDDGGSDSVTPRGFTGHEMLDDLGLVHMNGRIYDPLLGRMLSPDIVVQFPSSLQSYNRYSYVENNPLTNTDPTGFMMWVGMETYLTARHAEQTGRDVHQALQEQRQINDMVADKAAVTLVGAGAAAAAPVLLPTAATAGLGGAVLTGAVSGAAAGAASTATDNALNGRPIGQDVGRNTVIGGATGGLFGAAGHFIGKLLDRLSAAAPQVEPMPQVNPTKAPTAQAKALLPNEGNVGSYDDLIAAGSKGDNITPHHIPSANRMAQEGISKGEAMAVNMEQPSPGVGGRHRATFTYGTTADAQMTPRDALAAGVQDAKRIYSADGLWGPQMRKQFQQLIQENKQRFPTIFEKKPNAVTN